MLNVGAVYGAATGGFGGWLYGILNGPYIQELVSVVNTSTQLLLGEDLSSTIGQVGVLVMAGVLVGACIGTVVAGRTQY